MLIITIQLKGITPESTYEDRWKAMLYSAFFIQGFNEIMSKDLIHGPLPCNPMSDTIEGFLGDVNGYPNEVGVLDIVINNYNGLKIPLDRVPGDTECPFVMYYGDTSEKIPTGEVDEEGNSTYTVVYSGAIA